MPAVASGSVLKTVDSRETKFFGALVGNNTAPASRVTPVNFTTTAGATAGSAVSISVSSVTPAIPAQVGQYLLFRDNAGSYLARVSTAYTTGTTLVADIDEDIPSGAVAVFPPEIDLVSGHSIPTQTSTNNVSTYQHTGIGEVSRGDTTRSFQFSALKSLYSAGQRTLAYAIQNEKDVYFEIHDPNPDADTFTTNTLIRWGTGILSDGSETGNNGDKLSLDFTLNISGALNEVDPA